MEIMKLDITRPDSYTNEGRQVTYCMGDSCTHREARLLSCQKK